MKSENVSKQAASSKPSKKKSVKSPKPVSTPQPALTMPTYPGAEPLPGEMVGNSVEVIMMKTADSWSQVLDFYRGELTTQGLTLFESQDLATRGTLSFRTSTQKAITVLAATEDSYTRITIYVQQ